MRVLFCYFLRWHIHGLCLNTLVLFGSVATFAGPSFLDRPHKRGLCTASDTKGCVFLTHLASGQNQPRPVLQRRGQNHMVLRPLANLTLSCDFRFLTLARPVRRITRDFRFFYWSSATFALLLRLSLCTCVLRLSPPYG